MHQWICPKSRMDESTSEIRDEKVDNFIQSTLIISISLNSNYRLTRIENLVPVFSMAILQQVKKYCGKEEKLLLRSNFSSFPQYFQNISDFRNQITYSFVKGGASIYFFLSSANLICRPVGTRFMVTYSTNSRDRLSSWRNQQNGMYAQWRLRSALASVQSDQSLRCQHEESLGP